MIDDNHLIIGLETGSFFFLNVAKGTLHDHRFPRQTLLMRENLLPSIACEAVVSIRAVTTI
jgi:hypothetical protein